MSLNILAPSVRWKTWKPNPNMDYLRERAAAVELDPVARAVTLAAFDTFDALRRASAGRTHADIRSAASLTVRCDDCGGRAVAWVVWVDGRPLFIGDRGAGIASVLLLDVPGFAPPRFRCRSERWNFTWSVDELPGPGARSEVLHVSHSAGA